MFAGCECESLEKYEFVKPIVGLNFSDDDSDLQQEILDLSNQNSYIEEINKKLK